jgi:hypothetical protein
MTENPEDQKARNEEKKQAAEQIIRLQRREVLTPKLLRGLLNFDVALIAVVVAFGSFALYSRYYITAKIAFYLCAPLFLIVPVGSILYLLKLFSRKPTEKGTIGQRLLDKIKRSRVARSLARLGNDRRVTLFNITWYIGVIAFHISTFPNHPRLSLAMIVIYMAFSFVVFVLWSTETLGIGIYKRIDGILDALLSLIDLVDQVRKPGEASLEYITATEPSRSEADKANADALIKINESLKAIWEFVRKYVHAEDDENEPINTGDK